MKKGIAVVIGGFALLITASVIFSIYLFFQSGGVLGANSNTLTGTMIANVSKKDSWAVSANTLEGYTQRNINFSAEELERLYVESTSSHGTLLFSVSQGDLEKTYDLGTSFSGDIDLSEFEAGKILLRLNFISAKDADVNITWR